MDNFIMADNDDEVFNVRDSIYYRIATKYMQLFPKNVRRVIEFLFLFEAILVLYALVHFHIKLAQPANCLDHVINIWPKNGILRVEIIQSYKRYPEQQSKINKFLSMENSYVREYRLKNVLYKRNDNFSLINDFIKTSNHEKKEEVDIEPSTVELVENKFREASTLKPNLNSESFTNNINVEDEKKKKSDSSQVDSNECSNNSTEDELGVDSCSLHQSTSTTQLPPVKNNKGIFYENYIVEYSLNDEHLFLSSDVRDGLEIPVMLVTLDPNQNECFGNSLNRYFLQNYIGYDELLYASFKAVAQFEKNKGFLRNVLTWKYFPIDVKTQKDRSSYISSFFIMIIITFMISLYMRYLNYQLVIALNYLLNNFNGEISIFKCYVCIMGFMGLSSLIWLYFKDLDALFYIMLIVIMAEMYYTAFTNCPTTKKHWPKFFYLYLFMFYAYDYRFDGQYRSLSLTCSWSFILHSMVYFYHHIELPNVMWEIEEFQMYNWPELRSNHQGWPPRRRAFRVA